MSPSWRGIPDGTYLTVSEGAKVLFKFNAIKVWILYNFDLKDHLKSIEETCDMETKVFKGWKSIYTWE